MTDSLWRKRQEPEALKLALEALTCCRDMVGHPDNLEYIDQKITAIKEALAQPEQSWTPERIAGMARLKEAQDKKLAQPEQKPMHPQLKAMLEEYFDKCFSESAPQRTWAGLTDEELQPIADEYRILFGSWVEDFARAIEAKLKEKNT